jgi:hypothetical protein
MGQLEQLSTYECTLDPIPLHFPLLLQQYCLSPSNPDITSQQTYLQSPSTQV